MSSSCSAPNMGFCAYGVWSIVVAPRRSAGLPTASGPAASGAARLGRTDSSARPRRSLDDVVGFVDEILRDLGALGLRGLRVDDEFEVRARLDGQLGGLLIVLQDLQRHLPGLLTELRVVDAAGDRRTLLDLSGLGADEQGLVLLGRLDHGRYGRDDVVVGGHVVGVDLAERVDGLGQFARVRDRKSTRLNSSHVSI